MASYAAGARASSKDGDPCRRAARAGDEARAALDAAEPGTKKYRLATRGLQHFMGRVGKTQKRITLLRKRLGAGQAPVGDIDEARAKKLEELRSNSEIMLGRFLVVNPGYNHDFLKKFSILPSDLSGIDLDAVLNAENIRLVSLDNPSDGALKDIKPSRRNSAPCTRPIQSLPFGQFVTLSQMSSRPSMRQRGLNAPRSFGCRKRKMDGRHQTKPARFIRRGLRGSLLTGGPGILRMGGQSFVDGGRICTKVA